MHLTIIHRRGGSPGKLLRRGYEAPQGPRRTRLGAWLIVLVSVLLVAAAAVLPLVRSSPAGAVPAKPARAAGKAALGNLPLSFIENRGQTDRRASYYVQGKGASVFFTRHGLALSLIDQTHAHRQIGLRLDFEGARAGAGPVGENRSPAFVSYFKGRPGQWKTKIPTYSSVAYHDLWPGIDLVYSGMHGNLKYTFLVQPGADPSQIRMRWRGQSALRLNARGQVEVSTAARNLLDAAPSSYQLAGTRRVAIKSSYLLAAHHSFGFNVGGYDRSRPLVIDPAVFVYSGFIGGSKDSSSSNVALDRSGDLYVIGDTTSSDFPVRVGPGKTYKDTGGLDDVVVAKVKANGRGLVYAGYIGGAKNDTAINIAVDRAGAAYLDGSTSSTQTDGFPVTVGPGLSYNGGGQDAWVAKVKPDGTGLEYCGYIGGNGPGDPFGNNEQANGIAVDSAGNAYVGGFTRSDQRSFPNTAKGGFIGMPGLKGYDKTFNSTIPFLPDGWLAKVRPNGTGLDYATYIGGGGADAVTGISADDHGNAYVNLFTASNQRPKSAANPSGGFPITRRAFNKTYTGPVSFPGPPQEAAAAKIDTNLDGRASLKYLTYIGGGNEQPFGNKVDASGAVYITGRTNADQRTFPSGHGFGRIPGFDHKLNGGRTKGSPPPSDAFVVKLNPSGSRLDYATYIGGSGNELPVGIAVNKAGSAYISGTTSSRHRFPAVNGPSSRYHGGPDDAFVAKLNPAGTALDYAGFVGGAGDDQGLGMAVDGHGDAYISGFTDSSPSTFPVKVGPSLLKSGPFGTTDIFVAKIHETSLRVTGYRMTHRAFVVGGPPKRGTTFKYTLSEPARVKIVIAQRLAGRRNVLTRGTLRRASHRGSNRISFSGRIGSHVLKRGSYQATLTATDKAHNTSDPMTIRFTVA